MGSIPGLGRSPGEGNGNLLQCTCLGNPMDRRMWQAAVPGVTKESDRTYRLHNSNKPIVNSLKKAERRRIDAFELWCWRKLLRIPWTVRRSNQLILKEINPEYSLEGLMLKLKLHYFGHLMWRANLLEKTLMLGMIEGRRREWQNEMVGWHHQLYGHEFEQASGVGDRQGGLACCSPWGCKESDKTEWLNWTELK